MDKIISNEERELLSSKDGFLQYGQAMIDMVFQRNNEYHLNNSEIAKEDIEIKSYALKFEKTLMEMLIKTNSDVVFKYCESPIEKIFINSLQLALINNSSPIVIMPPCVDMNKEIRNFCSTHEFVMRVIADFEAKTKLQYSHNQKQFESFCLMRIGKLPFSQYYPFYFHYSCLDKILWKTACFLTVQAGFPMLNVDNKTIRTDLFIWSPADDKFNLVIECDGFEFHKDKDSFERDRKRDRVLKSYGCDVMRFSGGEIYKNPIIASCSLIEYLASTGKIRLNVTL